MKSRYFYCTCLIFLIGLTFFSCEDAQVDDPMPMEEENEFIFENVKLRDQNGEPIGCYIDCDDDFTNFALTEDELAFLDFDDTISINGNSGNSGNSGIIEGIFTYPNPISNSGDVSIIVITTSAAKIKFAIVNQMKEVLFEHSFSTETSREIRLSADIFADFPRKELHRLYYAAYNAANEIIFSGYGDIAVCEEEFNPDLSTCFEF